MQLYLGLSRVLTAPSCGLTRRLRAGLIERFALSTTSTVFCAQDKRPLVAGTQELMFLTRRWGYAPLQTQQGRWPLRSGRLEAQGSVGFMGLPGYRQTIGTLIRLQATAERGGTSATSAYLEGLRNSDPHARLWAAHLAYQRSQSHRAPSRCIPETVVDG